MHLADAFIQSDLHCIQVTVFYILSALAFPGNRTHDLGVVSAMLYHLSYRKATGKLMWQSSIPHGHTRYVLLSNGPRCTKFRHLPGSHVVDHFISWALNLNWWQMCDRMKVNMQCRFLWWEKQVMGEKSSLYTMNKNMKTNKKKK